MLTLQRADARRQRHLVDIHIHDQRPHHVAVGKQRGEYRQRHHRRARQRHHDQQERLTHAAAVEHRRFHQLVRQAHIELPQEERSERADQTGEHEREDRVQLAHLRQHQILRNDENLVRQHQLRQYDEEKQLLARELELRKRKARHRAEHRRAENAPEHEQQRIQIQAAERQCS